MPEPPGLRIFCFIEPSATIPSGPPGSGRRIIPVICLNNNLVPTLYHLFNFQNEFIMYYFGSSTNIDCLIRLINPVKKAGLWHPLTCIQLCSDLEQHPVSRTNGLLSLSLAHHHKKRTMSSISMLFAKLIGGNHQSIPLAPYFQAGSGRHALTRRAGWGRGRGTLPSPNSRNFHT